MLCANGVPAGSAQADGPVTTAPKPPPRRVPLIVPLLLDQRMLGDIGIEADMGGADALVDAARLLDLLAPRLGSAAADALRTATDAAGAGGKLPVDGLGIDGLTLVLDMASLSLKASVDGASRARRAVRLVAVPELDPARFDRQAGFAAGAGVTLFQSIGPVRDGPAYAARPVNGIVEAYATVGGFEGVTLTAAAETVGSIRQIRWRDVALVHDRHKAAIRLTAGEVTPRLLGFQSSGDVLGVGVERRYTDIRPFDNIRSTGRRQIVLEQESRVEFIVNGQSLGDRLLPAGPYDVSDFPLLQGGNNVQLVVEATNGQRQVIDFDVLLAPTLLGPGIVDFGGFVGYPTTGNLARARTLVATGFVEAGITSGLTLGGGTQAGRGVTQMSGRVSTGVGTTVMALTGAWSRNRTIGLNGHAVAFDLRHLGTIITPNDFTLSATAERRSTNFTSLAQPLPQQPERWRAAMNAGVQHPEGYGLTVGGTYVRARAPAPDNASIVATLFGRVKQVAINLTASRQFGTEAETRLALGAALAFGGRYNANARADLLRRERDLSLARVLGPELREWGGLIQASQAPDGDRGEARFQFRGQRLALEASHGVSAAPGGGGGGGGAGRAGGTVHESRWRLGSFVGFADGLFGFGRDGRQGFAVVRRHPTLEGAKLTLKNGGRTVGRSDGLGNLLVPIERAYAALLTGIAADPLPVGYDLGAARLNLLPGFGAGYAVTVGSDASLTVLGVFVNRAGGPVALISGELRGKAVPQPVPFFTNGRGRFAANRMAPGAYDIIVQGRVVGRLEVQRGQDNLVQMGTVALALD